MYTKLNSSNKNDSESKPNIFRENIIEENRTN